MIIPTLIVIAVALIILLIVSTVINLQTPDMDEAEVRREAFIVASQQIARSHARQR